MTKFDKVKFVKALKTLPFPVAHTVFLEPQTAPYLIYLDEDEWNSFYESSIEPIAIDFSNEFTRKLFSANKRSYGNRIVFESSSLTCASINTKLSFLQMVDRGAMTPNEWRKILNLSPIDGGDIPVRRLDTAPTIDFFLNARQILSPPTP